ncbi:hypothetical protein ACFO3J_30930 [Streptomyces polygonati]|uniref:Uncharacterized protein n=1 Tax=Streptomyces polygonati TaxID=1617087 RepID=A0ABV8I1B4_9ACTN
MSRFTAVRAGASDKAAPTVDGSISSKSSDTTGSKPRTERDRSAAASTGAAGDRLDLAITPGKVTATVLDIAAPVIGAWLSHRLSHRLVRADRSSERRGGRGGRGKKY